MFIGNEFETIMNNIGATTIVMIGCTTDGGVEATVREGFNRSYFMVIAATASALTPKKATTPRSSGWSGSPKSSTRRS
jgi:Amidases related to nicotinamidase